MKKANNQFSVIHGAPQAPIPSNKFTPVLPKKRGFIVRNLSRVWPVNSLIRIIRGQKCITQLYGHARHIRNARKIEIDVTYKCNLNCTSCNRSSPQAPSPDQDNITLEQIKKFIDESVERKIQWKSIMIIGGEPTLHPQLLAILDALIAYKKKYSDETEIILATNGAGAHVKSVLSKVPAEVIHRNTEKGTPGKDQYTYLHESFNDAPADSPSYKFADYSWGCSMVSYCGTGLTPYGYYVCPIAGGGIDRIFGLDLGRKQLPDGDDQMIEQRLALCRLCGHFKEKKVFNEKIISPTWVKAYNMYKTVKPVLSRY